MHFTKMHGCGNDYIYLDLWEEPIPRDVPALCKRWCPRHFGVGADGIILVGPPETAGAQARMRMFNADGSESEMCGNGLRCAAKLAHDRGHLTTTTPTFQTGAGLLKVELCPDEDGVVDLVRVDMGRPRLTPAEIPVDSDLPGPRLDLSLRLDDGSDLSVTVVGTGNPHAIHFCREAAHFDLETIGPMVECHPSFPNRTNFHVAHRDGTHQGLPFLRQRTWERGAGITMACGTGTCATVVAAILTGVVVRREAWVQLDGGFLHIAWANDQASIIMTGSATTVFTGELPDA